MVRKTIAILMLFAFLCNVAVATGLPRIVDTAELFTVNERDALTEKALALSEEYNLDIIITTTNDAQGHPSARVYGEHFFEEHGYGVGDNYDGVLLIYDMDHREVWVTTSGKGIQYITDYRVERLIDAVFDNGLAEGEYYRSANAYLERIGQFLADGVPANQHTVEVEAPEPNRIGIMDVGIGAIGALVSGAGFYGTTKRKYSGKPIPHAFDYRTNSVVQFAQGMDSDALIRSFVNTRRIPKNNGSSGGGSDSGRSSSWSSSTGSGRSYGGGGRKF